MTNSTKYAHYFKTVTVHQIIVSTSPDIAYTRISSKSFRTAKEAKKWAKDQGLVAWNY
jgi:hypothetical protein